MKEKILVIGPMPPPIGGIQTVLDQMTHLKFEHFELIFMNVSKNKIIKSNIIFNSINFFYRCLKLICLLAYYRPKIVHIHTPWKMGFWQSSVYQKISKLMGKKTIIHMHSGGFKSFYTDSNRFEKRIIIKTLSEADSLIVLSESWREYYYKHFNNNNISIVPNAIDSVILNKYKKYRKKSKTARLLFVGRVEKAKGIYELLEAVKMLKDRDIHLYVMGAFVNNEKEIRDLCAEYNITDKVTFLGMIEGNDRFKYFANSDIFLLPSYWEALPMSILEAMAFGMPIIATNIGAIPEVVKEENGILMEPRNSKKIAKAIIEIKNNKKIKYETNNIAKIKKLYDIAMFRKNLSKIYETLK